MTVAMSPDLAATGEAQVKIEKYWHTSNQLLK